MTTPEAARHHLAGNPAPCNPQVHDVGAGEVPDYVFALFHLFGYVLAPRLRDAPLNPGK